MLRKRIRLLLMELAEAAHLYERALEREDDDSARAHRATMVSCRDTLEDMCYELSIEPTRWLFTLYRINKRMLQRNSQ